MRKLTIRTKLAATLAVPLVALAAFAAAQVSSAYDRADQVKRQDKLATSASGPTGVLAALESERDYESLWQIGAADLADPDLKTSADATTKTNAALTGFRLDLQGLGGDAASGYISALSSANNKLVNVRHDAERHAWTSSSAPGAAQASQANKVFNAYSEIISQLLNVDEQSSHAINDAELRSGAELLNAIARQTDVEKQIAVKSVFATTAHDSAIAAEVQRLDGVRAEGENELARRSDGKFTRALAGTLHNKKRLEYVNAFEAAARDPQHVKTTDLVGAAQSSATLWRAPQTITANDIMAKRAQELSSAAQDAQRNWLAIAGGSVLLAIALLWLTNRWITRPLKALADQAVAMAGSGLPAAVQEILDTPVGAEVTVPEVAPVTVRAGGEVHDVEVALNKVQQSAVELAVEQARLRGNVADAFVNLGRRNQNLLSRQLEFITQLENDESDPETLEHLFRLDHLATRMRRNAESLLVLAGHEPPRTWSAPVEIGDVVRGALGEVEGYQRVRLRHVDDARVDGTAAVDVSHVIAELVENALSFSPRDSEVEVYGRSDASGYVLTIVDQGIGMAAEDLDRANGLISSADARTFAPSRFLGHYVVAQLARRHGLAVHLASSPAGGLTAMVALPVSLLGGQANAPDVLVDAPEPELDGPPPALPRRETQQLAPVVPITSAPEPPAREPVHEPPLAERFVDAAPAPLVAVPEPEPFAESEPEPEPIAPEFTSQWASEPAPELPVDDAFVALAAEPHAPAPAPAPAPEPVAFAPEPEPEPEPVPPVAAEPPAPPKPRIGIGSFADLRATSSPPRPAPAPQAEAPSAPPVVEPSPDVPSPLPVDKAAAFAQVADAVDAVTQPDAHPEAASAPALPGTVFAEDFLPQKLPKRGRRASKLGTPWAREKPAQAPLPAAPHAAVPGASPVAPPSAAQPPSSPAPGAPLHFPPGGPAMSAPNGNGAEPAAAPAAHESEHAPAPEAPATEGEERFAFFAAFRAAAERAREEAGIDDRRVGQ